MFLVFYLLAKYGAYSWVNMYKLHIHAIFSIRFYSSSVLKWCHHLSFNNYSEALFIAI